MPKKQKNKTSGMGGLGNALRKAKNRKKLDDQKYFEKHGEEKKEVNLKAKLESCTEQNGLNEFLYEAELAQKKFEGVRDQKIICEKTEVIIKKKALLELTDKSKREEMLKKIKFLRIPRRPDWRNKTKEEIEMDENKSFIEWRNELKNVEDNFPGVVITPYEKNLEVWKQLWRVVDKSDVVVQIVDCRNPFFYRCEDVDHYVKNVSPDKKNFLILNKADLLPDKVRILLSKDLCEKKIDHIFFSAKWEQEKIDAADEKIDLEAISKNTENIILNTHYLINRENLLKIFAQFKNDKLKDLNQNEQKEQLKSHTEIITIGMVGFPNVGKSSLINALCGKKMVGVDCKPGKTKNFQTIYLTKEIMLCDCPGLVFPSIVSSKGEMICNGVLPLITLAEFLAPMYFLISKVPAELLVRLYKIPLTAETLNKEKDPIKKTRELLQMYSGTKGYLTGGSGIPDESKAAKNILNDYITGKILHFTLDEKYQTEIENIYNKYIEEFYPVHTQIPLKNVKKEDLIINELQDIKFQDNKKLEKEFIQEESNYFFQHLTENDILNLIDGKKVMGKKLIKEQRRDLKFMIKSSQNEKEILNQLNNFLFGGKYKNEFKNKNQEHFN